MKITELAQATTVNDDDIFPVVQNGETKKVRKKDIFPIDQIYNPTSENPQSGVAVEKALKTVNGVKVITDYVDIVELSSGIYMIDRENGGNVSFSPDVEMEKVLPTGSVDTGWIFVTEDVDLGKKITIHTKDETYWQPTIVDAYVDADGLCRSTTIYASQSYIDEQIAKVQSQLCEEKLYTFSVDELGTAQIGAKSILTQTATKTTINGRSTIRVRIELFTGQINEDDTITPYFDLPIYYNVNPTLMADNYVQNACDFSQLGIKSPLISNDFIFANTLSQQLLDNGESGVVDYNIGVLSLYPYKNNGVTACGIAVVWDLFFIDLSHRDNYYPTIQLVIDSITHLALKYEKHNVPTVESKKLI